MANELVLSLQAEVMALRRRAERAEAALVSIQTTMVEALDWEGSLTVFVHEGQNYLRWGYVTSEGERVWDAGGDLWLIAEGNGGRGCYAGRLRSTGEIDSSAEVLSAEPDIAP